jgi:sugar phosphate isomerase/epimerase
MPKRLSFQLYSARNFQPWSKIIPMLAKTGYTEVEGFGANYENAKKTRSLLDKNGLTMPTAHFSLDMLENDRSAASETIKTLGIRHVYAPYVMPDERPKNAAGWKKFGKRLAKIGEWVMGEGASFGWHNHDFEFVKLPTGETPHELIFEAAPMLDWECDLAWAVRAKQNPLALVKRYADRITSVHVKDIAPKGENTSEDGWADAGQGTVKWPDIFAALKNTRCRHFVMEHDNPADIERFAKRSFDFVSKN